MLWCYVLDSILTIIVMYSQKVWSIWCAFWHYVLSYNQSSYMVYILNCYMNCCKVQPWKSVGRNPDNWRVNYNCMFDIPSSLVVSNIVGNFYIAPYNATFIIQILSRPRSGFRLDLIIKWSIMNLVVFQSES